MARNLYSSAHDRTLKSEKTKIKSNSAQTPLETKSPVLSTEKISRNEVDITPTDETRQRMRQAQMLGLDLKDSDKL